MPPGLESTVFNQDRPYTSRERRCQRSVRLARFPALMGRKRRSVSTDKRPGTRHLSEKADHEPHGGDVVGDGVVLLSSAFSAEDLESVGVGRARSDASHLGRAGPACIRRTDVSAQHSIKRASSSTKAIDGLWPETSRPTWPTTRAMRRTSRLRRDLRVNCCPTITSQHCVPPVRVRNCLTEGGTGGRTKP